MKTYTIFWDYNISVTINAKSKSEALDIFCERINWLVEGMQDIGTDDIIEEPKQGKEK